MFQIEIDIDLNEFSITYINGDTLFYHIQTNLRL